jgi:hypothetical protein
MRDIKPEKPVLRPSDRFVKFSYDDLTVLIDLMECVDLEPEEIIVKEKAVQIRSLMVQKRAAEDAQDRAIRKERSRRYKDTHGNANPSKNGEPAGS